MKLKSCIEHAFIHQNMHNSKKTIPGKNRESDFIGSHKFQETLFLNRASTMVSNI